jgi:histidine ammonia-lyase
MNRQQIVITGRELTCAQVRRVARDGAGVQVAEEGVLRARRAWDVAREVAAARPVYGRTTGVGANHLVDAEWDDADAHGLRLLRSHAGGAGPLLDPERVRAMLVVRLNQLAAGGAGTGPGALHALARVLNLKLIPPVPAYGAIGTGDLTALAVTALCLLGERAWREPERHEPQRRQPERRRPEPPPPTGVGPFPPRYELRSADALAFISSNAGTLGEAAIACRDLRELLEAQMVVMALSLLAVSGSTEPYAPAVHEACPHPGQRAVAAVVRGLLGAGPARPGRIQDPYGYRAFPQVHGPAVDALDHAERAVSTELNAAAENPLIDVAGRTVWHNGNFHTAYVGLALDAVRAALFQTAALSAARLGTLMEPGFTGLPAFQAGDAAASSGIMIVEYVAHAAVADIRRYAAPAALGSAVLSRGVEEHAGFSTQSARATTEAVAGYRVALACELLAAVRALRMLGRSRWPPDGLLGSAFEAARAALDPRTEDRPLDADLTAAERLLPALAPFAREAVETDPLR